MLGRIRSFVSSSSLPLAVVLSVSIYVYGEYQAYREEMEEVEKVAAARTRGRLSGDQSLDDQSPLDDQSSSDEQSLKDEQLLLLSKSIPAIVKSHLSSLGGGHPYNTLVDDRGEKRSMKDLVKLCRGAGSEHKDDEWRMLFALLLYRSFYVAVVRAVVQVELFQGYRRWGGADAANEFDWSPYFGALDDPSYQLSMTSLASPMNIHTVKVSVSRGCLEGVMTSAKERWEAKVKPSDAAILPLIVSAIEKNLTSICGSLISPSDMIATAGSRGNEDDGDVHFEKFVNGEIVRGKGTGMYVAKIMGRIERVSRDFVNGTLGGV